MFPLPGAPFLHTLFETVGVMLAFAYYQRLRKNTADNFSDQDRMKLLMAATFGAFFGSRLLGSSESPALFFAGGGAAGWLYYFKAKTIVGGLLGGLWAIEGTKWWLGINKRSGDIYVYPLILAMMIGRLGCLGMGVGEPTFGIPTDSWLGIDLGDGIPRHATALYEIIFLGMLWAVLRWVEAHYTQRAGRRFMLFLSGYLSYRLLIGFLQPMERFAGLGAIQWACLVGLVWYIFDEDR